MKEERKRILKLVEDGKLSAEEAILLIEKLEEEYEHAKTTKLHELSVEVLSQEGQAEDTKKKESKVSSITAKLLDFVDTAVQKVKELDIDFPFGPSVQFSHIFQLQQVNVEGLFIHIVNGSVNIETWQDEDIRVECDVKAYKTEDLAAAREFFLQNSQCQIEGNRFVLFVDKKTLKVNTTIYVPDKVYHQLKIKLFNGPIRGEQLKIENLKAKTANGMISFKHVKGKKAEAETANGQMKWNTFSYENLELETVNGMIDVQGDVQKLDVQSFNGNLLISLTEPACHTLYAKTTTGNIELKIPEQMTTQGELKSNLGSFSYGEENITVIDQRNEVLQKEVRFKKAGTTDEKLTLFAETKTGSVTIT